MMCSQIIVKGEDGICPSCGIYIKRSWNLLFNNISYYYSYCNTCKRPALAVYGIDTKTEQKRFEILYPVQKLHIENIEELKEYPKVYELFQEASLCAPHSSRAGLILARTALEYLVKDRVEKYGEKAKENLFENIKTLEKLKSIDSYWIDVLHDLREIGNSMVHNIDLINSGISIELQEIKQVWDFIGEFIKQIKKREGIKNFKEKVSQKKGHNKVN